jgi:hypothetical protein
MKLIDRFTLIWRGRQQFKHGYPITLSERELVMAEAVDAELEQRDMQIAYIQRKLAELQRNAGRDQE